MITEEQVRELFNYEAGNLVWKEDRGPNKVSGRVAGSRRKDGYIQVRVRGTLYLAHRLIFLWHYGFLPKTIDHVDRDPSNNLVDNLRECTVSENAWNSKTPSTNTSGFKGVSWNSTERKWRVDVCHRGQKNFGGYHKTRDAANEVAIALREKLHGEFCRHSEEKSNAL